MRSKEFTREDLMVMRCTLADAMTAHPFSKNYYKNIAEMVEFLYHTDAMTMTFPPRFEEESKE